MEILLRGGEVTKVFEANTARQSDPGPAIELGQEQRASFPVEKLPLLLCILVLSALAGGSTAWIVVKIISLFGS